MKTISTWAAALVMGIWLAGCLSTGEPNDTVKQAFKAKFGEVASVNWTHNSDYSYAHFTQRGRAVVAVFGNDGKYIETDAAQPIQ